MLSLFLAAGAGFPRSGSLPHLAARPAAPIFPRVAPRMDAEKDPNDGVTEKGNWGLFKEFVNEGKLDGEEVPFVYPLDEAANARKILTTENEVLEAMGNYLKDITLPKKDDEGEISQAWVKTKIDTLKRQKETLEKFFSERAESREKVRQDVANGVSELEGNSALIKAAKQVEGPVKIVVNRLAEGLATLLLLVSSPVEQGAIDFLYFTWVAIVAGAIDGVGKISGLLVGASDILSVASISLMGGATATQATWNKVTGANRQGPKNDVADIEDVTDVTNLDEVE